LHPGRVFCYDSLGNEQCGFHDLDSLEIGPVELTVPGAPSQQFTTRTAGSASGHNEKLLETTEMNIAGIES
jgi:hypothetical protein